MRTPVIATTAFFMIAASTLAGQAPAAMAGRWESTPEELKLSSDFDRSVWGPDATSIRSVLLVVRPPGDATLTVTRKVVDRRGRTVAGSVSIEEAKLRIGAPRPSVATRLEHDVQVIEAERKYPDDPGSRFPLEGLVVRVTTFADNGETLEIRVEPPEGRGAFWESLHRSRGAATRRTSG